MAANNSNSDGICTTEAIRTSVARTSFGYGDAVAESGVKSTTQDLRLAYPATECNIPAVA